MKVALLFQYIKNLFRKNPLHFQEFSHPGDSDYEEDSKEEEEDDSDRPECPYGIDCYRCVRHLQCSYCFISSFYCIINTISLIHFIIIHVISNCMRNVLRKQQDIL